MIALTLDELLAVAGGTNTLPTVTVDGSSNKPGDGGALFDPPRKDRLTPEPDETFPAPL